MSFESQESNKFHPNNPKPPNTTNLRRRNSREVHQRKRIHRNRIHPVSPADPPIKNVYQHHYKRKSGEEDKNNSSEILDSIIENDCCNDISFICGYATYLKSELASYEQRKTEPELSNLRSLELVDQLLIIFQDLPEMNCFHRKLRHSVFLFIDRLMENYGLQFLNRITDLLLQRNIRLNLNTGSSSTIIDIEANFEKKIIVFIEDIPPSTFEKSRLARMLIVCLLGCNIHPIVIPCNDLDDVQLESLKAKVTKCYTSSCDTTTDINQVYRRLLKIGFLSSLETQEDDQVIIFDVDKRLNDYNDFIAEAECRGHQLLFMRYHTGINKGKFVQKIIQKILLKCRPDENELHVRLPRRNSSNELSIIPARTNNNDFVTEVDPQEYSCLDLSDIHIPVTKQKDSTMRTFFKFITDHLGRFPLWATNHNNSPSHNLKSGEIQPSTITTIATIPKRLLQPKEILPLTWKEQSPQTQSRLLSFSKLFHSKSSNTNSDNHNTKQISIRSSTMTNNNFESQPPINRNILPRFTDEQFDRIFVAPALYARKCEQMEKQIFGGHSSHDLDDLNEIFANCTSTSSSPQSATTRGKSMRSRDKAFIVNENDDLNNNSLISLEQDEEMTDSKDTFHVKKFPFEANYEHF